MVGFSGMLVQYELAWGPAFHWCADRHLLGSLISAHLLISGQLR